MISTIHNSLRAARTVRRGATANPDDVPYGICKEYPRMQRIPLTDSPVSDARLVDAIYQRTSHVNIPNSAPPTLENISALLSTLQAKGGGATRQYPSGGTLYPIETYLVGTIEKNPAHVFHYHPKVHSLERLWPMPAHFTLYDLVPSADEGTPEPKAALIFTAMWARSAAKYGDFSYNLALLEAGHMAQNILLMATALGMSARPMGGFADGVAHDTLDIDGESEQAVYTIALF